MHLTEEQVQKDINRIASFRDKNERLSWKRKRTKMETIIDNELEPVNDEILNLILTKKYPIMDKINELRMEMVKECVHPKDLLEHHGAYVQCKFCDARIALIRTEDE